MTTRRRRRLRASVGGFTLIEVIGALVIFSVGVLMVMNLTGTLSLRMERAAIRSELSVRGQERLDSLEFLDYNAILPPECILPLPCTAFATTEVRGSSFYWLVTVTDSTALARHAKVWLLPSSGSGPSFTGSTFVTRSW